MSGIDINYIRIRYPFPHAGEIWVNSVRILGLTKVKNGVIFAIEDYLYADALAEHLDSNKKKKKKKKEKENEVLNFEHLILWKNCVNLALIAKK